DNLLQALQFLGARPQRSEARQLQAKDAPGFEDLEEQWLVQSAIQPDEIGQQIETGMELDVEHHGAVAVVDVEEPLLFERTQGLADGGAVDAEGDRQLAL